MTWSRFLQSILGLFFGLAIVLGAVGGLSYFYLEKLSRMPPEPEFAEAKNTPESALSLPSTAIDSYPALVLYPDGLILRDRPQPDAEVVGKLALEETVIVTGTSEDGQWQQVNADEQGLSGWVSAGNLKRAQ